MAIVACEEVLEGEGLLFFVEWSLHTHFKLLLWIVVLKFAKLPCPKKKLNLETAESTSLFHPGKSPTLYLNRNRKLLIGLTRLSTSKKISSKKRKFHRREKTLLWGEF